MAKKPSPNSKVNFPSDGPAYVSWAGNKAQQADGLKIYTSAIQEAATASQGSRTRNYSDLTTNLSGKPFQFLGYCSHHNTIFGDVLLLGIEMKIKNWSEMEAGDDAAEARLFNLNDLPPLAFSCHEKIVEMFKSI